MNHPVTWTAPQPFWRSAGGDNALPVAQPQILRFASDEFIEELLATLERNPTALPAYQAQAETWRKPLAGPVRNPQQWVAHQPARMLPLVRRKNAKAGTAARPAPAAPELPLKLYQPAHLRHYLVAGALVCRTPGLPDRAVDAGRQKVSFVVRRLVKRDDKSKRTPLPPPTDLALWDEYAWVLMGKGGEWRYVGPAGVDAASAKVADSDDPANPYGEERLAMFPARFNEAAGQPRRMFVGSVPVGRREPYQAAQTRHANPADDVEVMDPRLVLFHTQVLGPWKSLVNSVMRNGEVDTDPASTSALRAARVERIFKATKKDDLVIGYDTSAPDPGALRAERSRLQTSSWLLLLDLMLFLKEQLPGFWKDNVKGGARPASGALRDLYDALDQAAMPSGLAGTGITLTTPTSDQISLVDQSPGYAGHVLTNLLAALRAAAGDDDGVAFENQLEAATSAFELPTSGTAAGWPGFLFLFADPWFGVLQPPADPPGFNGQATDFLAERIVSIIGTLGDRLQRALAAMPLPATPLPEPTLASMQPADMREAWYVMRLVYERPDCAPFEGTVVSRATVPFQMAGFFDPDAPARPIRIGLPVDISPAGLRKFDKNAVFMLSDMLCGQVDRFKGITFGDLVLSVLPWPFHKDLSVPDKGPCKDGGDPLGVMCSLSIPIITICALILLMVIVALLDFIFRWLPLFVVCFPFPGFRGKKGGT